MQSIDKKRKQDLGIFYTDPRIVNFIYDILLIWKEREEKKTGRWESRKHYPSVIDPAVGEGIFLKVGLERGFTTPKYVFGIDIDEAVKKKWEEINLLRSFGSRAELEVHFYHQNGLIPLDSQKRLRHKKGGLREFDAVVGNPPYGGIGVNFQGKLSPENMELMEGLENYEILSRRRGEKSAQPQPNPQTSLFEFRELGEQKVGHLRSGTETIKLAQSTPVEILFLERFTQLAKPGGWIAIIIPDGILTNSNAHYVREFIAEKTRIEAIVSLPRGAFKNVGTTAKTNILFLQKLGDQEKKQDLSYPVFIASVDSLDESNFRAISNLYKEHYNKTMKNNKLIQTIKDEKGQELVMVRADKTLKELMDEKPSSRWDPGYWHPAHEEVFSRILKSIPLESLDIVLKEPIIAPDHVRASKREEMGKGYPCEYRTLKDLLFTGLNYAETNFCSENAFQRLKRTRLEVNDILFAGSGVGAIGRLGIVEKVSNKSCVGDLFILRSPKINPYYLYVYLLTEFGQSQIKKIFHGIQSAKISTKEIAQIKIAILDTPIQKNVESEYKKMSKYHNKAMYAKKDGHEEEYTKNIGVAEQMLNDLISKTEAVIRGECKDVI